MAQFRDSPGDRDPRNQRSIDRASRGSSERDRRKKEQAARSKTGTTIGGAVGSVIPIPFAKQALGWAGGKIGENLPSGPLKSTNQFGANTSNQQQGGNTPATREGMLPGNQFMGGEYGVAPGTENTGNQPMSGGALQPWQQAGTNALGQQQALLGMGGQDAQQAAFEAFGNSPGQQFLRDRARKATMRSAPSMGGMGGGNVRSALNEQAVGFAAQDFNNQFNRLGQLSGQGFQATTAGLDENFRGKLNAQQLAQMNQQQKAGQTEGILNLVGQFSEPLGDMFSGIGDTVSDWMEW
jgi:hypothetical protein